MKKNITIVISRLNGISGGAERIYCELANMLARNGNSVTCFTYDKPGGEPFYSLDDNVKRITAGNCKRDFKTRLKSIVYKFLPKRFELRDRLRWHGRNDHRIARLREHLQAEQPDIVISLLPPANTVTLLAAKGLPLKVIATNHNVPEQDYTTERWGSGPYERKIRLAALDHADAIHVLFPLFKDWFPEHLKERIVAIPNYIPDGFASSDRSELPREKIVLGVGRLTDVKNYMTLVQAWSLIGAERDGWTLKICGEGRERGDLEDFIQEKGLSSSITLAGAVSDIKREYQKASIFCHPAKFEGFGLSVVEALACGLPVVAFEDTPGLKEYLKDGENALLTQRHPDQAEALALKLKSLMVNSELRECLSQKAPASVQHFSTTTYEARWLKLIGNVTHSDCPAESFGTAQ
ncbi:glycosyltransferase [Celeribacter halophilus]|uniref:glycosyltransferase n=1 Tax=Celeribacter halophilus TaxID=576117 RepID=UPI003A933061